MHRYKCRATWHHHIHTMWVNISWSECAKLECLHLEVKLPAYKRSLLDVALRMPTKHRLEPSSLYPHGAKVGRHQLSTSSWQWMFSFTLFNRRKLQPEPSRVFLQSTEPEKSHPKSRCLDRKGCLLCHCSFYTFWGLVKLVTVHSFFYATVSHHQANLRRLICHQITITWHRMLIQTVPKVCSERCYPKQRDVGVLRKARIRLPFWRITKFSDYFWSLMFVKQTKKTNTKNLERPIPITQPECSSFKPPTQTTEFC